MTAHSDTGLRSASPLAIGLALAAVYILWGSTYLAIRFALEGYPPFTLAAIRMAIAGSLMYAVLRWRGVAAPTRRQWRTLAVLSIFMVVLSNALVNLAETQVGSGLAAIAVASMPLFAGVFAMLRGRHPSRMEWAGLVIGFLGVIWLSVGGELSGSTLGLVCLIIAPLAWAWGSIWSRDQDLPEPFMAAAGQMLVGTVWLVVVALVSGERITTMPTFGATAALLYLVVAVSFFVNLAETQVSSGLAAIAVASMPLFAGVFAMLRGRHPSRMEWAGLVIGFLGVIWLSVGGELSGSTLGLVCLIIAPLAWAWGSIWSRDQDLPEPFMAAAGQMLVGTVWLVVVALVSGERTTVMPTFGATAALLYLVVAGSIFGFTAYIWLLHHVRPALATSYAYVNPPLAVLIGALIGGERFTTHDLGAMAVILAGVVLITLAKARGGAQPAQAAPVATSAEATAPAAALRERTANEPVA